METHTSPYRPPLEQRHEFAPGQRVLLFSGLSVTVIRRDGRGYWVRKPFEDRVIWWEGHHFVAA